MLENKKQKPSKYTGLKNIGDSYKNYTKEYPKTEMSKSEFSNICYTFLREALDYMLYEAGEVRLLCGMGVLKIIKKKRDLRSLMPDWKSTKELWGRNETAKKEKKLVYHLNEHTGGYYYRVHWRKGRTKNISVYSFVPVRGVKRELKDAVLSGQDYLE